MDEETKSALRWAKIKLHICYIDSKKALKHGVATQTALQNIKQYELLERFVNQNCK